jgi:hypothetical protein
LLVRLQDGFGGANIALSDRLYNPSDCDGERLALFGLPIDARGKLLNHGPIAFGRSCLLGFRWDLVKRQCEVSVDGEKTLTLPMLNAPNMGVSYLRIRSTAETTDLAGMLIENVAMEVSN